MHDYDLCFMPLDGSAPTNLTNGVGAKNEIRFRYVQTMPDTTGAPAVRAAAVASAADAAARGARRRSICRSR